MTTAQIVPALVIPLVLWRVYARVRKNIGRQPFRPRRLVMATAIFSVFTGLLGWGAARHPGALPALVAGLAVAVPLGLLGLRLTRFDVMGDARFYTPNPVIGVGVTLLFIGRLAFRLASVFGSAAADYPQSTTFQSPLTLAVFGLTAGYYITYYIGVVVRGRALSAPIG